MLVRLAERRDEAWVEEQYRNVGFMASCFEKETLAIAEIENVRAGLGRIVPLDETRCELGGIVTLNSFRGRGVARQVVTFLMEKAASYPVVYCLPFLPLRKFYASFGFTDCPISDDLPPQLTVKHCWCNQTYAEKTLLMVKKI